MNQSSQSRSTAAPEDSRPEDQPAPRRLLVAGALCLALALAASLLLVLQHLVGMGLPGCGPESACARATSSVWGKIPRVDWPVAHVGLAYFAGLLAAWLVTRGRLSIILRWIARIGVLGSVTLIAVMTVEGHVCTYCMTVHAANIGFVAIAECACRSSISSARAAASFAGTFLVVTGVLAFVQSEQTTAVRERDETARARAERKILEKVNSGGAESIPDGPGFTGRYREGPERAAIRIVVFSDYQCPDCKRIEEQVDQILRTRPDVSFSAKHFPLCVDCNEYCRERDFNPHPNACRAARAAEAVGLLGDDRAFFTMHRRLFQREGRFGAVSDLRADVESLGLDFDVFAQLMRSDETLTPILEDVQEGTDLGLHYTPMVFVNGVELKGFAAPGALLKTVAAVARAGPPPLTAAADRPPPALEKFMSDWKKGYRRTLLPPDSHDWTLGPADAVIEVVVWGDYQESNTAELDALIRGKLAGFADARYSFRHYPFNEECNPEAQTTRHESACLAARVVEAAGQVGGAEAYWAMHERILADQPRLSEERLKELLLEVGLDPAAVFDQADSAEVAGAIQEDASAALRVGLRAIPLLYVNGRPVPRWRLEGADILGRVFEEARKESR